jgi:hypothetical protein
MAKSKRPGGSKRSGGGHGKPLKHSQFKKGVSGNPRKRRTGSRNLNTLFRRAARRQVTVTVNGIPRPITRAQAIVLGLAAKAHAGNPRALLRLLSLIDRMRGRQPQVRPAAR